jgi:hypothetical protein
MLVEVVVLAPVAALVVQVVVVQGGLTIQVFKEQTTSAVAEVEVVSLDPTVLEEQEDLVLLLLDIQMIRSKQVVRI